MNITNLLDRAKSAKAITSDNQLAKHLGISRQAVSSWRHGVSLPDPVACSKLADMAGIPLAQVLGIVGEARALSREEKAVWRRLATAAVVVLATGMAALYPLPAAAAAGYAAADRCIMRTSG